MLVFLTCQVLDDKTSRAIKDIENAVHGALSAEHQTCKDAETQLVKVIDDRFYSLSLELAEGRRRREEAEQRLTTDKGDQLHRLAFAIEHEQRTMYVHQCVACGVD